MVPQSAPSLGIAAGWLFFMMATPRTLYCLCIWSISNLCHGSTLFFSYMLADKISLCHRSIRWPVSQHTLLLASSTRSCWFDCSHAVSCIFLNAQVLESWDYRTGWPTIAEPHPKSRNYKEYHKGQQQYLRVWILSVTRYSKFLAAYE